MIDLALCVEHTSHTYGVGHIVGEYGFAPVIVTAVAYSKGTSATVVLISYGNYHLSLTHRKSTFTWVDELTVSNNISKTPGLTAVRGPNRPDV